EERKRRHRDEDTDRDHRKSRRRDPDRDSRRERDRSRDRPSHRDRDRERRRSRTPESSSSRRDRDRGSDRHRHRHREDRSPRRSRGEEPKRIEPLKRSGPLPSQEDSFAVTNGEEPEKPKEKPNYKSSGLLAAASNSIQQADGTNIALKYHEPAEARKPPPKDQWKLFIFKGGDVVDTADLALRSCWLIGRDAAVVDLQADHPSLSKQHAVIQFRYTEKRNEFGDKVGRVKPYIIDLESANGTMVNGEKIPEGRYLELRNKDVVMFGHSTREYVLMLPPK
ncbi:SMAD/FHA domain-containing protein, partial [Emericellopsis atlantica]